MRLNYFTNLCVEYPCIYLCLTVQIDGLQGAIMQPTPRNCLFHCFVAGKGLGGGSVPPSPPMYSSNGGFSGILGSHMLPLLLLMWMEWGGEGIL